VVGAASRDIDPRDPRGWRLGGTVSYAALAAARLGVTVRALIGADDQAASAHELDTLRTAGVDVVIAQLDHGPVFENRQVDGARRQFVHGVSDKMSAKALPQTWRDPTAVLLGPVANELGNDWLPALPADALVALAWQGLLREMAAGQPVGIRPLSVTPLVHRADVLFVSSEDVAAGGPLLDELLRYGHELFITHGDRGAIHVRFAGGARHAHLVPARPKRKAIDTTGAGDVFLAAYVAARLQAPQLVGTGDEWRLAAIAAAAASLNVAVLTLADVPGTRELCEALMPRRD
jgi:sugar/nucleoside kinase (ribokinase family)